MTADARRARVLDALLFVTLFVTTWHKVHWQTGGQVTLEDLSAFTFLVVFAIDRIARRDARLPRAALSLVVVLLALEAVFLAGFFNIVTTDALGQYAKGMAKYLIHFAFLICAVAHVVRRGERTYMRALAAFLAGLAANSVYGLLALAAQVGAGVNLDRAVIGPLTFGQGGLGGVNVYGQVSGLAAQGAGYTTKGVFRVNGMTLDPNHLGIMLNVPILLLAPFALRDGLKTRRGIALWLLVGFFLMVEALTLSRSALFGLFFGAIVLAIPLRHQILRARVLVPVALVLGVLVVAGSQSSYVQQVVRSRATLSDRSAQVHFQLMGLVGPVLDQHPYLGLGLNTFSVYYQFLTGRTDWGPHSFYVALLAETGLVGFAVFLCFLGWLFLRLAVLARAANALRRAGDPREARAGPLAYGLIAALIATLASNIFYLTMQFYYFYGLVLLIVAAPAIYAPIAERARVRARPRSVAAAPVPA
jgi:O-antigen ligase